MIIQVDGLTDTVVKIDTTLMKDGSWHFDTAGEVTIVCSKGNFDDTRIAYEFKTIEIANDAYLLELFNLVTKYLWFTITGTSACTVELVTNGA